MRSIAFKTLLRRQTVDRWAALIMFVALFFIPIVLSLYDTLMFGKIISYMIFALALDVLWGAAGLSLKDSSLSSTASAAAPKAVVSTMLGRSTSMRRCSYSWPSDAEASSLSISSANSSSPSSSSTGR